MEQTKRFETDDFQRGIQYSRRNIHSEFSLNEESNNITMGKFDGLGPRYGASPIPYHCITNTVAVTRDPAGLLTSENAASGTYPLLTARNKVYGLFVVNIGLYNDFKTKKDHFAWIVASDLGTGLGKIVLSMPGVKRQASVSVGTLERPDGTGLPIFFHDKAAYLDAGLDFGLDKPFVGGTEPTYRDVPTRNRCGYIQMSVVGVESRAEYMLAKNIGTDDASNPGTLSFYARGEWDECAKGPRIVGSNPVSFYTYDDDSVTTRFLCKRTYTGTVTLTSSSYVWSDSIHTLSANFIPSLSGSTVTTHSGTFGTATDIVYVNPNNRINSAYQFFGVAAGKALIAILKDDQKGIAYLDQITLANEITRSPFQWIDLNAIPFFRESRATIGTSGDYTEDGEVKRTVWYQWPSFARGTALTKDSAGATTGYTQNVRLGDANSGVLRANTIYEFTFSAYNKALNYETNVGVPAKVQTASDDFVRLSIYRRYVATTEKATALDNNPVDTKSQTTSTLFGTSINHIAIRFYYRALGTFEWLPAAEIDAVDFFLNPERDKFWICENPIALAPGGQPGGFNDYSPVPSSDYHTVTSFQNRAVWISNSILCFSLRNNPLAYPIRNQVVCPRGRFLGGIAHAYPGQAVQDSRFVVFGTEETYQARFITGAEEQQFVRVGPDDGGVFPVEGSNFRIDVWTSVTAFGGRAAVTAKGILYWWGPQGVYMDDGRDLPVKVSGDLEPWVGGIYEPTQTENIVSIFNDDTDEVIWFYKPPGASQDSLASKALVLNVRTMGFYNWSFNTMIIDDVQRTSVAFNRSTNTALNGQRIIIYARETGSQIQRALFLDANTNGGEHSPSKMYMVREITNSGANRRLELVAGPASLSGKTGLVSIVGYNRYTDTAEGGNQDGVYDIASSGASFVIIEPTNGVVPAAVTISAENDYFPVYFAADNSIAATIKSQFWAPGGIYAWWMYLYAHFVFRVQLLRAEANSITVAYQGLVDSGAAISQTLSLTDNSRTNCQILNSIPPTRNQVNSQALQLTMTTTHIGGLWSLQYLGYDVVPQNISEIRYFEG